MKIEAYKCDKCGTIQEAEHIEGVQPIEEMFDTVEKSYPLCKPEKTRFHFCLDCYRSFVLVPAANAVNRAKDEKGYTSMLKDLAFTFKKTLVLEAERASRLGKKTGKK